MISATQYLYWGDQSPQQFSWFKIESGEISHRGESTLESIAEVQNNSRIVLLVPTQDVLLTELALPTRNPQKIRQAIPYALEEQLTEDVEALHFAIDKVDSAGRCGVAVVKQSKMVEWLKPFDDAGIRLSQILPDMVTLPVNEGECSLVVGEDSALLRLSQREGYVLPREGLVSLINGALALLKHEHEQAQESAAPELLRIYPCHEVEPFNLEGLNIKYEFASCDGGIEQHTMQQLSRPQTLDLLQGEFNRKEQLWRHLKPWRAAAVLFLSVFLVQGFGSMVESQRLAGMEQQLQADIEKVYRDTFPEARKIINPRLQMEQKLKALSRQGEEGVFSRLLVIATPEIAKIEGANIEVLRYKQDSLELDIVLKDLPSLDLLKEQLTGKGLQTTIQNATSTEDSVSGRITIKGGGS